ncbi:hypothetical protein KQH60_12955 [Mycetohabitans sp. B8]|nr:hypothetical protein [Mycetohabitans sp. B8]
MRQVSAESDIRVGDMIGFDISRPCLRFDTWRNLLRVDDAYDVVEIIETFF